MSALPRIGPALLRYTTNLRVNVTRVLERFRIKWWVLRHYGYEAKGHPATIPSARHVRALRGMAYSVTVRPSEHLPPSAIRGRL